MNITIEAPFTLRDIDRSTINVKINELDKFEPRMTQVNVFFKEDDGKVVNAIRAEIIVRVPGQDLFSESTDKDAMKAFIGAYNAVKRMVKKRRDILNDHQSQVKKLNNIVNDNF